MSGVVNPYAILANPKDTPSAQDDAAMQESPSYSNSTGILAFKKALLGTVQGDLPDDPTDDTLSGIALTG